MDIPGGAAIVPPMTPDSDILIVGGGLNGPALALALAQAGLSVTVVDALARDIRADPGFDGRSYALSAGSVRLLRAIGIWPQVAAQAQAMHRIMVSDGRAGEGAAPQVLEFDSAEIEGGPMGWMVEDRHLRRAFLEVMERTAGIALVDSARVVAQDVEDGLAAVTLEDGRRLTARLVAGCDGRASGTAERAGITRQGRGYGQTAVTCAVAHELPHNGVAHQFFMPAGPLAILPLPGNRSSIVWSETDARAAELMAMGDEAFLVALRPAFGSFLGGLRLEGVRFSYPLKLTLARDFTGARLALVGDAAHGMHPIAGQGLNAGLRDVAALAQVLSEARARGEDIGASPVLDRYAQARRFDTATLALATDTVNRLFSNDNPLLRAARDLGLGAVNAIGPLRRAFIREAAGLTGDLPPLMR